MKAEPDSEVAGSAGVDFYSFDVFDTLIQRSTLEPKGVFFAVREEMRSSGLEFPEDLIDDYPEVRMGAESNVRYAYRSTYFRSREISFHSIFLRLAAVYGLTGEQVEFLKRKELEWELETCQPCAAGLTRLKALLSARARVVMISDMYLPEEFLRKLLLKADPVLNTVKLYLSSTYGVQKSTGELYELVAQKEGLQYSQWRHYGDNAEADGRSPARLGIDVVVHDIPKFNEYESRLVAEVAGYDTYCIAAQMARSRFSGSLTPVQEFVCTRVSMYLIPYVIWVLQDAGRRGIQDLYFIARDGYHLKRVADAVIEARQLAITTHYVYGSRKVWWVPAFIDGIDSEFFIGLESLTEPCSLQDLLSALYIEPGELARLCPSLEGKGMNATIPVRELRAVVQDLKVSEEYRSHILALAASRRPRVCEYLKQAVQVNRPFAFVEYWGRGFTQTCVGRLLSVAHGRHVETQFYYARSIYQNDSNSTRFNFSVSRHSLLHVERLFSNFPVGTVISYESREAETTPVAIDQSYDRDLFHAMEELLPRFAADLASLGFLKRTACLRRVFDWAHKRFPGDLSDPVVWRSFGHLKDVHRNFGAMTEYAPSLGWGAVWRALRGLPPETASLHVSLQRSTKMIRILFQKAMSLSVRMSRYR